MVKQLLKTSVAAISILLAGNTALAEVGIVKVKTDAPAGTELRIQAFPYYDSEVSGADKSEYFGMYKSKGPGTEITISGEQLTQIEVYGCHLTELTVVKAPDLNIVRCYNNKISALDLSACPELSVLDCHNNKISALDLSSNTKIEKIDAADNALKSLELGQQALLTELKCGGNPLESIDLSQCSALESLYIQNCGLSNIDLSKNPKLNWVFAFGNNIKDTAMDTFIAKLPEAEYVGYVYMVNTLNPEESNVMFYRHMLQALQSGWVTCDYLDGATSESMIGAVYRGVDYVPEISDNTISLTTSRQIGETISLTISAEGDVAIEGVEEAADLTGKKAYTLKSQTVVIKGDVRKFECPDNDITDLAFSNGINLTHLYCQNNKIENLDLSGADKLALFYCHTNALKTLNVDGCTSITRMDCYKNKLKGQAMTSLIASLYDGTANKPIIFVIDTKAAEGLENNVVLKSDVAAAKAKAWTVKDWSDGDRYGMGVDYEGTEPTEPERPAQYFTVTRPTTDHLMFSVKFADDGYTPQIEGGTLAGWNGESLTVNASEETIKVYGDATEIQLLFANVSAIDVSELPGLTKLNVALNDISTLDISNNTKLASLSCEGNLLKALDASKCPDLTYLNIYGNDISGDNMTALVRSLPQRTEDNYGTLVVIDRTYTQNANVCLKSDVAIALGKYWVPCEKVGTQLIQYEGEDPSGIDAISAAEAGISFDAASKTIRTATPAAIEVYNIAGRQVAKHEQATEISTADLPAGIYIVRAAGNVLKIAN